MEPAKIDWKNLEWRFVEDKAYEQINAPKWFDFLNPNDNIVNDHAWLCTPECNHPKTAADFLRSSPFKVVKHGMPKRVMKEMMEGDFCSFNSFKGRASQ